MPRGSERSLYSIADMLEVHRGDIGKSIQLRLNQKMLFDFEKDEKTPGRWELADYERRTLLLLSDTPRLPGEGRWGVLFQARALGKGEVTLRFIPQEASPNPNATESEARQKLTEISAPLVTFDVTISRY